MEWNVIQIIYEQLNSYGLPETSSKIISYLMEENCYILKITGLMEAILEKCQM